MACTTLIRGIHGARLPLQLSKFKFCECAFARSLSSTALLCKKQMPPRPKVNENEIEEKFLRGSGPGGQKINKTSSAVQLRHIPTGIVVKSQETRSREQNRKIARQLLASKLEDLEKGDQSRNGIINEVKKKRKASKRKKSLRKYRKLDEAKVATAGQIAAGDEVTSAVAGELEAGEEEDEVEESESEGEEEEDEGEEDDEDSEDDDDDDDEDSDDDDDDDEEEEEEEEEETSDDDDNKRESLPIRKRKGTSNQSQPI